MFGLWFSADAPVDTNRPPDAAVWYNAWQTEYRYPYLQSAPVYLAVAAVRTGSEEETGKVHRLFLDWSNVPLRSPDDVIALDAPLSAVDDSVWTAHENEPDMLVRL